MHFTAKTQRREVARRMQGAGFDVQYPLMTSKPIINWFPPLLHTKAKREMILSYSDLNIFTGLTTAALIA
jgi:hypothetical protein